MCPQPRALPNGGRGSRRTAGPASTARPALTDKQSKILTFIERYLQQHGYPPTLRDIGGHFGIRSTNAVNDHLRALVRKGYLERDELKSRSLRPIGAPEPKREPALPPRLPAASLAVGDGPSASPAAVVPLHKPGRLPTLNARIGRMVTVPVLGRIAAGQPIPALEEADETVDVDVALLGQEREVFALRIVGESMIGDGIHPGDFIFVRKQETARSGEIVVALIEGDATVKRYYLEGDRVRFQPSNPTMQPLILRQEAARAVEILGVVVGLYRRI